MIPWANELCSRIVTEKQKSPEQFCFAFTGSLLNISLKALEYLIQAIPRPFSPGKIREEKRGAFCFLYGVKNPESRRTREVPGIRGQFMEEMPHGNHFESQSR